MNNLTNDTNLIIAAFLSKKAKDIALEDKTLIRNSEYVGTDAYLFLTKYEKEYTQKIPTSFRKPDINCVLPKLENLNLEFEILNEFKLTPSNRILAKLTCETDIDGKKQTIATYIDTIYLSLILDLLSSETFKIKGYLKEKDCINTSVLVFVKEKTNEILAIVMPCSYTN